MQTKLFTIYDKKSELYTQPFHVQTSNQAIRLFSDAINDETAGYGKHPEDYVLVEVGTWSSSTAKLEQTKNQPYFMQSGLELKAKEPVQK